MSNEEKINVYKNVPDWFNQVVCGLMLSDATFRMNGKNALMGIQQTPCKTRINKKCLEYMF